MNGLDFQGYFDLVAFLFRVLNCVRVRSLESFRRRPILALVLTLVCITFLFCRVTLAVDTALERLAVCSVELRLNQGVESILGSEVLPSL